jgi:hypothetical protein
MERQARYVGGRRVELLNEGEQPEPRPSTDAQISAAATMLAEKRETGETERLDRDDLIYHIEENVADDEPRPHFRNTREALDHRAQKRQEASEEAEWQAEADKQRQDEEAENEIARARQWNEADETVLGHLGLRAQQFTQDSEIFTTAFRQAEAMRARGEQVPFEVQQKLHDEAVRLQAEQAELRNAAAKVQRAAATKEVLAEQKRLHRNFPELKDAATRERMLEYATDKGVPREEALACRDPVIVGQWLRAMQAEDREKRQSRLDRPRPIPTRFPPLAKGGASPREMTVSEAKADLAKRGTMAAATNYLVLKSRRAREARNG